MPTKSPSDPYDLNNQTHQKDNMSTISSDKDKDREKEKQHKQTAADPNPSTKTTETEQKIKSNSGEFISLFKLSSSATTLLPSSDQANNELRKGVNIINSNPYKKYKLEKQLGKGGHGVVSAVRHIKSNTLFAMKQIDSTDEISTEYYKYTEIGHLKMSDHPNIIKYYDTYSYESHIFCLMEYMNSGTLASFLTANYLQFDEQVITYILHEVLKGILYLHNCNRLHRDIKSDNVLLASNGDIKLADFGYTVQLTKEKSTRTTQIGTPCWMAPEIIKNSEYTQSIDVWSFGILAIELAEGDPPYLNNDVEMALSKIISCPPPTLTSTHQKWTEEFRNFIGCCLQKNPAMRKTAFELMKHQFMSKNMDKCKSAYMVLLHDWLIKVNFQKPKGSK